jgi:hypothetical protein
MQIALLKNQGYDHAERTGHKIFYDNHKPCKFKKTQVFTPARYFGKAGGD